MNPKTDAVQALCPSSKCQPGAQLLGIVREDGHVDLLREPITIDEGFVAVAKEGRLPEMRFRFAHKCIKAGCAQWTGKQCGMIDQIMAHLQDAARDFALPECAIRPKCRWYMQHGAEACKVCPYVITDVTMMEGVG